jgi:ubiquinone/menaquinone biosynthesis C-methylase UbiE
LRELAIMPLDGSRARGDRNGGAATLTGMKRSTRWARRNRIMAKRVRRPSVRDGYDQWSATYDHTPNPLIALDRRYTANLLRPRQGEHILDAACGTGAYFTAMLDAGSHPAGLDLSRGMLTVTRYKHPSVPLAQADLNAPLPLQARVFDTVLCALVGEHLADLRLFFREVYRSLAYGGRLLFSVFHPELAAAGIEANFERDGAEYRLGAMRHTVSDYVNVMDRAGFRGIDRHEFCGDEWLAERIPSAQKYRGRPLLLIVEGRKHG